MLGLPSSGLQDNAMYPFLQATFRREVSNYIIPVFSGKYLPASALIGIEFAYSTCLFRALTTLWMVFVIESCLGRSNGLYNVGGSGYVQLQSDHL